MAYQIDPSYKEVPQRIADLKAQHPDARLRPVNPEKPFDIVTVGDKTFVVYAAACYRDENDTLPGIGVAWEPMPGTTPYTKNSELMNAETSAWGRAIVACLRSESKTIASEEDVRNRQAEQNLQKMEDPYEAGKRTRAASHARDGGEGGPSASAPTQEGPPPPAQTLRTNDTVPFNGPPPVTRRPPPLPAKVPSVEAKIQLVEVCREQGLDELSARERAMRIWGERGRGAITRAELGVLLEEASNG